jgi:hypothetical protein
MVAFSLQFYRASYCCIAPMYLPFSKSLKHCFQSHLGPRDKSSTIHNCLYNSRVILSQGKILTIIQNRWLLHFYIISFNHNPLSETSLSGYHHTVTPGRNNWSSKGKVNEPAILLCSYLIGVHHYQLFVFFKLVRKCEYRLMKHILVFVSQIRWVFCYVVSYSFTFPITFFITAWTL